MVLCPTSFARRECSSMSSEIHSSPLAKTDTYEHDTYFMRP